MGRESRHVHVTGLPEGIGDERINTFFSAYGGVQQVKRSAKGVIVSFMEIRSAQKALAGDMKLDGAPFRLSYLEAGSETTSTTSASNALAMAGTTASGSNNSNSGGSSNGMDKSASGDNPSSQKRSVSPRNKDATSSSSRLNNQPRVNVSSGLAKRISRPDTHHARRDQPQGRSPSVSTSSPTCTSGLQGVYLERLPQRSDGTIKEAVREALKKHGRIVDISVEGEGDARKLLVIYQKVVDMEKLLAENPLTILNTRVRMKPANPIAVQEAYNLWLTMNTMSAAGTLPNGDTHEISSTKHEKSNAASTGTGGKSSASDIDVFHPKASRTLYVGGLESRIPDETLRRRFGKFGTILDVDVKNFESPSPFAFIQFADIDSAVRAINAYAAMPVANKKGKKFQPNFGRSMATNKLWIGSVPPNASEDYVVQKLKTLSEGVVDVIYDSKIHQALVVFNTNENALSALQKIRAKQFAFKVDNAEIRVPVDFCSDRLQDHFVDRKHADGSGKEVASSTTSAAATGASSHAVAPYGASSASSKEADDSACVLAPPPDPPSDMPSYHYGGYRHSPTSYSRRNRSRSRERSRERSRHRRASSRGRYEHERNPPRRKDRRDRKNSASSSSSSSSSSDSGSSTDTTRSSSPLSYSNKKRDIRREEKKERERVKRRSSSRKRSPFDSLNKWSSTDRRRHSQSPLVENAPRVPPTHHHAVDERPDDRKSGDSGFCEEVPRPPLDPPPAPPPLEILPPAPTPPPADPPPKTPSSNHHHGGHGSGGAILLTPTGMRTTRDVTSPLEHLNQMETEGYRQLQTALSRYHSATAGPSSSTSSSVKPNDPSSAGHPQHGRTMPHSTAMNHSTPSSASHHQPPPPTAAGKRTSMDAGSVAMRPHSLSTSSLKPMPSEDHDRIFHWPWGQDITSSRLPHILHDTNTPKRDPRLGIDYPRVATLVLDPPVPEFAIELLRKRGENVTTTTGGLLTTTICSIPSSAYKNTNGCSSSTSVFGSVPTATSAADSARPVNCELRKRSSGSTGSGSVVDPYGRRTSFATPQRGDRLSTGGLDSPLSVKTTPQGAAAPSSAAQVAPHSHHSSCSGGGVDSDAQMSPDVAGNGPPPSSLDFLINNDNSRIDNRLMKERLADLGNRLNTIDTSIQLHSTILNDSEREQRDPQKSQEKPPLSSTDSFEARLEQLKQKQQTTTDVFSLNFTPERLRAAKASSRTSTSGPPPPSSADILQSIPPTTSSSASSTPTAPTPASGAVGGGGGGGGLSSSGFARNATGRPPLSISIPPASNNSSHSNASTPASAKMESPLSGSKRSNPPSTAGVRPPPSAPAISALTPTSSRGATNGSATAPIQFPPNLAVPPPFPTTTTTTAAAAPAASHDRPPSPLLSAPPPPPQLPPTNTAPPTVRRDSASVPTALKSPPMTPSTAPAGGSAWKLPTAATAATSSATSTPQQNHQNHRQTPEQGASGSSGQLPTTPVSSKHGANPMTSKIPTKPPVAARHDSMSSIKPSQPHAQVHPIGARSMSVSDVKKSTHKDTSSEYLDQLFNNKPPTDFRKLPKIEKKQSSSTPTVQKEKEKSKEPKKEKKDKEHKARRKEDGTFETKEERAKRKELERMKKDKIKEKSKEKEAKKEKKSKEERREEKKEKKAKKAEKAERERERERKREKEREKEKKAKKKRREQQPSSDDDDSSGSDSEGEAFAKLLAQFEEEDAVGGYSMYDRVKRRSSAIKDEGAKKNALQKLREKQNGKKGPQRKRVQLDSSDEDDDETHRSEKASSDSEDGDSSSDEEPMPSKKSAKKSHAWSSNEDSDVSTQKTSTSSKKHKKKKDKKREMDMNDVFGAISSDEEKKPHKHEKEKEKKQKHHRQETSEASDSVPIKKKKADYDLEDIFGPEKVKKSKKKDSEKEKHKESRKRPADEEIEEKPSKKVKKHETPESSDGESSTVRPPVLSKKPSLEKKSSTESEAMSSAATREVKMETDSDADKKSLASLASPVREPSQHRDAEAASTSTASAAATAGDQNEKQPPRLITKAAMKFVPSLAAPTSTVPTSQTETEDAVKSLFFDFEEPEPEYPSHDFIHSNVAIAEDNDETERAACSIMDMDVPSESVKEEAQDAKPEQMDEKRGPQTPPMPADVEPLVEETKPEQKQDTAEVKEEPAASVLSPIATAMMSPKRSAPEVVTSPPLQQQPTVTQRSSPPAQNPVVIQSVVEPPAAAPVVVPSVASVSAPVAAQKMTVPDVQKMASPPHQQPQVASQSTSVIQQQPVAQQIPQPSQQPAPPAAAPAPVHVAVPKTSPTSVVVSSAQQQQQYHQQQQLAAQHQAYQQQQAAAAAHAQAQAVAQQQQAPQPVQQPPQQQPPQQVHQQQRSVVVTTAPMSAPTMTSAAATMNTTTPVSQAHAVAAQQHAQQLAQMQLIMAAFSQGDPNVLRSHPMYPMYAALQLQHQAALATSTASGQHQQPQMSQAALMEMQRMQMQLKAAGMDPAMIQQQQQALYAKYCEEQNLREQQMKQQREADEQQRQAQLQREAEERFAQEQAAAAAVAAQQHQQVQQQPMASATAVSQQQQQAVTHFVISERYPPMWRGTLAMKAAEATVQLYMLAGNSDFVSKCLNPDVSPVIRINQRMRIDRTQMNSVVTKMQSPETSACMICLPCGMSREEVTSHHRVIQTAFIDYFTNKMAAGIANMVEPTSGTRFLVHVFPPGEFPATYINFYSPELYQVLMSKDAKFLFVVLTPEDATSPGATAPAVV